MKIRNKINPRQKGFTFIEVLVGVAICGAISTAMMSGLFTGYTCVDVCKERTYSEIIIKSQVEYIKMQDYVSVIYYDPEDPENRYETVTIPDYLVSAGYSVEIETPVLLEAAGISGYELQGVTVNIIHQGSVKLTMQIYRVGLAL